MRGVAVSCVYKIIDEHVIFFKKNVFKNTGGLNSAHTTCCSWFYTGLYNTGWPMGPN